VRLRDENAANEWYSVLTAAAVSQTAAAEADLCPDINQ